jgi:potassium/hydrogen antiporter
VLLLLLAVLARPVVVAALLAPFEFRKSERVFIAWSGLKGAVPILLAAFAVLRGVEASRTVFDIVFVVVLLSVAVQGTLVPWVAGRLAIPMREVDSPG